MRTRATWVQAHPLMQVKLPKASAPRFQRIEADAMKAILSELRNRSVLRDAILFAAANSHRRSELVNTDLMRPLQSWLRPLLAQKTNTIHRLEVRIVRPQPCPMLAGWIENDAVGQRRTGFASSGLALPSVRGIFKANQYSTSPSVRSAS